MEEIRSIALDEIKKALDDWGFEDAPGFATYVDGIVQLVGALENSNEFEFYTVAKKARG